MPDDMFFNRCKYYFFLTLSLLVSVMGTAQSGGLGGPSFNMSFGQALTDQLSVAGPAMQFGYTAFAYTDNTCPAKDKYSVVSGIPSSCNDSSLISLFADNTPYPDNNGYMMMLSDVAHSTPKIVFEYTPALCYGVDYQFSAALINLDKPTSFNCHRFSSFTLEVRDGAGTLLGSTTTGDMQFAVYNMGYHFTKYFVDFRLQVGTPLPVTVRIIDEPKPTSGCNNFVGIDDIKVAATGAEVNIGFEATTFGYWVKSSCFQENKSFTMNGIVETSIINPAVQWEQSTDEGLTWSDIPGATSYTLTQNFPIPDTFLFRLRAADRLLISSPGCGISSDLLKVQVDGIPALHRAINNSPVCAGNEIKLDAEGGTTYEWHGPNGFYDNIKFPGIYKSQLPDSGWYYADIITTGGCRVIDSTYVTMIGTDIRAWPDTTICIGNSVTLNTGEGVSYLWSPLNGLSSANMRQPVASPKKTTIYTIALTDKYGCSGTADVTVAVKNEIEVAAKIFTSKYICRMADSILFINSGTGVIDNSLWDFGNGKISSEENPPVQYYNNVPVNILNYTVRLTVTDTAGCSDQTSQTLKLEDMCNMAVPSAFTPNGDGVNDYFWPLNAFKLISINFVVFNRKGNKIFETKTWPGKWDGTFKGEPQDPGTYVWVFEYTDAMGKKLVQKGTVVLMR